MRHREQSDTALPPPEATGAISAAAMTFPPRLARAGLSSGRGSNICMPVYTHSAHTQTRTAHCHTDGVVSPGQTFRNVYRQRVTHVRAQSASNSLMTASLWDWGSPNTSMYVLGRIFSAKASTTWRSPSQSREISCWSVSRLTRDLSVRPGLLRARTPTICSPVLDLLHQVCV